MAKEKTSRCAVESCNKKIPVVDRLMCQCQCGKQHCIKHRFPENHSCTYDFRNAVDRIAAIEKIRCVAPKLTSVIS
jgi:predicted nucleic acid binding AN1-type Zn finger protein